MGPKLRFFLVLVIPLVLAVILYNPFERIELKRGTYEVNGTNVTKVWIPQEEFEPNLKNLFKGILEVPLDLKLYEVCFENKDTKIIYGNKEEDSNITSTVKFDDDFNFTVPYRETRCVPFKANQIFTYNWAFNAPFKISSEILLSLPISYIPINKTHYWRKIDYAQISPNTDSYAKPEGISVIIKIILAYASMLGLIWLSTRIYIFVRWGIRGRPENNNNNQH